MICRLEVVFVGFGASYQTTLNEFLEWKNRYVVN